MMTKFRRSRTSLSSQKTIAYECSITNIRKQQKINKENSDISEYVTSFYKEFCTF